MLSQILVPFDCRLLRPEEALSIGDIGLFIFKGETTWFKLEEQRDIDALGHKGSGIFARKKESNAD